MPRRFQEEKSFQSWFVPSEAVAVPEGFAARVARRAFAGDSGVLVPARPHRDPARAPSRSHPVPSIHLRLAVAALVLRLPIGWACATCRAGAAVTPTRSRPWTHEVLEGLDELQAKETA